MKIAGHPNVAIASSTASTQKVRRKAAYKRIKADRGAANVDGQSIAGGLRAVRRRAVFPWVLLCIEKWLNAPTQLADGILLDWAEGTPQGGVISPLLANLCLHCAFDLWMRRDFPDVPFERYADDVICHCRSEAYAARLIDAIAERFAACFLTLHPQKTKIAYGKNDRRRRPYPTVQFDFLGYAFRLRRAMHAGKAFVGFNPGISTKSAIAVRQATRDWRLHLHTNEGRRCGRRPSLRSRV